MITMLLSLALVAQDGTLVPIEQSPGIGIRRAEPGEQIYLYARGTNNQLTPVGVTIGDRLDVIEKWQRAFKANDEAGLKEMVESKKVALLPSGTVIKVIEYQHMGIIGSKDAYAYYRARIMSDGPMKDKEVLVQYTHAKFCEIIPNPKPKAKRKTR
jgi:hypothetical protein